MSTRFVDQFKPTSSHELNQMRGLALGRYNELEGSLFTIFAFASGARTAGQSSQQVYQTSSVAYAKISGYSSRVDLILFSLKSLLPEGHQKNLPFLRKQLNALNAVRNPLAHWVTSGEVGSDGKSRYYLHKPIMHTQADVIFIEHIEGFMKRVQYLDFFLGTLIKFLNNDFSIFPQELVQDFLLVPQTYPPEERFSSFESWQKLTNAL